MPNRLRNHKLKLIKYYYYYLFFNAYWTSSDIGEEQIPRQNAVFYMMLMKLFFLGGISFTLHSVELITNLNILIITGVALILISTYFYLSEEAFKKKYEEYKFLEQLSKKRRLFIFFSTIILAGISNVIGAFVFAYN